MGIVLAAAPASTAAEPVPSPLTPSLHLLEDILRAEAAAEEAAPVGIVIPGPPAAAATPQPAPLVVPEAPFPVLEGLSALAMLTGGAMAALGIYRVRVRRHLERPHPLDSRVPSVVRLDLMTRPWRSI